MWGDTSKENRNKIDKIVIEAAKTVMGNEKFGRSNAWILKQMKWLNAEKSYENATQNYIYKMINSDNDHYFKEYLTQNRNIRNRSQNKLGHHDPIMGQSTFTQKSFLYRSINLYNNLPKNLTLIKTQPNFKKWLKKYNIDNKIKIRDQDDNIILIQQQESNNINKELCYNHSISVINGDD